MEWIFSTLQIIIKLHWIKHKNSELSQYDVSTSTTFSFFTPIMWLKIFFIIIILLLFFFLLCSYAFTCKFSLQIHWPSLGPLISATRSILCPHWNSSGISFYFSVLWGFGSAGPALLHSPIYHRWGSCWGGLAHNCGFWPAGLFSPPAFLVGKLALRSKELESCPCPHQLQHSVEWP